MPWAGQFRGQHRRIGGVLIDGVGFFHVHFHLRFHDLGGPRSSFLRRPYVVPFIMRARHALSNGESVDQVAIRRNTARCSGGSGRCSLVSVPSKLSLGRFEHRGQSPNVPEIVFNHY